MSVLPLAISLVFVLSTVAGQEYQRVCYYTNWSQYRLPPATFFPENIDTNLCSHIIYAFADMEENVLVPYEINDFDLYQRINALKQSAPDLKTSLAVGGWTFGTSKFSLMFSSFENRTEFIDTSIDYLRTHGFDGFDLDFEYPGSRGSPTDDKDLFAQLVQEMRVAFDREALLTGNPRLGLTIAVPAGKATIDAGYEIATLCAEADTIHLMAFDLNGQWENDTGIHAPLFSDTDGEEYDLQRSVRYAAEYWVAGGCPRDKMIISMPLYGRGWTLHPLNRDYSIGSPAIAGSRSFNYTQSEGMASWAEICRDFLPLATEVWDDEQQSPYAYYENQWMGYDNIRSLTAKTAWLKEAQFSGWWIWSLDHDDFNGEFCGVSYPLLKALNLALLGYIPGEQTTAGQAVPPPDVNFCADNGYTDGDYPDPMTCTRFYRCQNSITYSYECPPELVYNPVSKTCDWPENLDPVYLCTNCEPEYCPVDENGQPMSERVSKRKAIQASSKTQKGRQ